MINNGLLPREGGPTRSQILQLSYWTVPVKIRDAEIKIKWVLWKNSALPSHTLKELPLLVGLLWTGGDGASHVSASRNAFLCWGLLYFYSLSTAHSLTFPLCLWHEDDNAPSPATNRQQKQGLWTKIYSIEIARCWKFKEKIKVRMHILLIQSVVWFVKCISDYYANTSSETLLLNTLTAGSVAKGMKLKIDLNPDGTDNLELILLLYREIVYILLFPCFLALKSMCVVTQSSCSVSLPVLLLLCSLMQNPNLW